MSQRPMKAELWRFQTGLVISRDTVSKDSFGLDRRHGFRRTKHRVEEAVGLVDGHGSFPQAGQYESRYKKWVEEMMSASQDIFGIVNKPSVLYAEVGLEGWTRSRGMN